MHCFIRIIVKIHMFKLRKIISKCNIKNDQPSKVNYEN